MGRLFDAGEKTRAADADRRSRDEVRRRAEAVDQALEEASLLDTAAGELGERLKTQSQSVQPVVYASFRKPGAKWLIEHARAGADYIIQMFPLRPPKVAWQDVIVGLIATMDAIFPRNIKIIYSPPNEAYQIKFYTIKVEKVVGQPGWERACKERALHGLIDVDVWA